MTAPEYVPTPIPDYKPPPWVRGDAQREIAIRLLPGIFAVNLKASETTTWCVETALHAADILLTETGWANE